MGSFFDFLSKKLRLLQRRRERQRAEFREWYEKIRLIPASARPVDPKEDYLPSSTEEVMSIYYDDERIAQFVLTHKEEEQLEEKSPHRETVLCCRGNGVETLDDRHRRSFG